MHGEMGSFGFKVNKLLFVILKNAICMTVCDITYFSLQGQPGRPGNSGTAGEKGQKVNNINTLITFTIFNQKVIHSQSDFRRISSGIIARSIIQAKCLIVSNVS